MDMIEKLIQSDGGSIRVGGDGLESSANAHASPQDE